VKRSFAAKDLVQLPQLGALGAEALARTLVQSAKAEPELSPALARGIKKIDGAWKALQKARIDRRSDALEPVIDRDRARREENAAWSSLQLWIRAWTTLAEDVGPKERKLAHDLERRLFHRGHNFSRRRFEVAWADAETLLEVIERDGTGRRIEELGGALFLESVKRAHRASSKALGMVAHAPRRIRRPPMVALRLAELRDRLREYVLHVSAHSTRNAKAEAQAQRLLSSLAER
jgi:hypothetical protein